jgi:signal transduction histidine kinase
MTMVRSVRSGKASTAMEQNAEQCGIGASRVFADYLLASRRIALAGTAESAAEPASVAREGLSALLAASRLRAGAVYLLDDSGQRAVLLAEVAVPEDFGARFGRLPLGGPTPITRALRTFQPITAPSDETEPLTRAMLAGAACLAVPFHVGSGSGALCLLGDATPPADEVIALQIAAGTLGQALAAARARQDEARQRARSSFLTDVARVFSVSLDLQQVLDAVVRLATPLLGDWAVIYLREGNLLPLRAIHHHDAKRLRAIRALFTTQPLKVGEGVAGNVVLSGEPRIYREFDQHALRTLAPRNSRVYREGLNNLRSWACLPLMAHGRGLGAIVFATEQRPLGEDDMHLATALAEMAAAAVDNARLYDAERALRHEAEAAQTQLALADRQKDEFLSLAAHELRTPLTSAQGFTQVLLRRARAEDDPSQRLVDGLTVMQTQLRRIGSLLNELLDLSRIQTGSLPLHRTRLDLVALVRETCEGLRALPQGERITLQLAADAIEAEIDRDRIEQIVINLVENGLKYSPGGGEVTVTLGAIEGEAVLKVRDRGLGVPPDAEPFMFQRYYRIPDEQHRQINGLGIGLYVCREIAERHGGSIRIEQPDGPGALFVVRLPLRRAVSA